MYATKILLFKYGRKAMKKQIILVLSFLIFILCLTGCSQEKTISGEKIDEMTEIANNVVNQKGYVLPEGYIVTYPDNTTNARIKITDNTNSPKEYLEIVFDISKEEIEIVDISVGSTLKPLIVFLILAIGSIIVIVYAIIRLIITLFKKIKNIKLKVFLIILITIICTVIISLITYNWLGDVGSLLMIVFSIIAGLSIAWYVFLTDHIKNEDKKLN